MVSKDIQIKVIGIAKRNGKAEQHDAAELELLLKPPAKPPIALPIDPFATNPAANGAGAAKSGEPLP